MTTITVSAPTGVRAPKMRKTLLGYVPISSPFYDYHPATRLVMFIFFGVVPVFIDVPEINFILLLIMLGLLRWGKVDLRRLRIYLPLIVTVAIFMFTVVFLAPGKDPTYTPIAIGSFTIYYQPVFFTFASYWAEQARGLDTSAMKFSDQAKLYMMYLIPLFSIALRRADEISNALFARGYTLMGQVEGGGKRSDYILMQYQMTPKDWVWVTIFVILFVGAAVAQYGFGLFRLDQSPLNLYLQSLVGIGSS
ncbi:MAG: hypothetical protein HYR94_01680 [Chloroflexi bacterium]|nr:hypothetical protein [Chloroflexota bacterium]